MNNFMQYPATQQQQYVAQARPAYANGWNNRIRPVSSIEEAKASIIDFDGSVFYFSDLANKRIYTKQINLDGTALLNMYELKETPIADSATSIDTANFVTRSEFESAMKQLETILANMASQKAPEPQVKAPSTENGKPSFNF